MANSLTIDGAGNIYVAGSARNISSEECWIVRKSSDGGTTWVTVDDYVLAAGFDAQATALTVDGSGNIYSTGYATNSSGLLRWIVRKSIDAGVTWSVVNNYVLINGFDAKGIALTVDGSGNIYVAGYALDASFLSHWIVRKSTNAGSTWATVDNYNLDAVSDAQAASLTVDGAGNIYSGGRAMDNTGVTHWIIRKSTDAGTTWTVVDDYNADVWYDSQNNALTADTLGNIYAAGSANGSGPVYGIVRKSSDSGATWGTVDNYSLFKGKLASAEDLSVDGSGNIFSVGYASDSSNILHWIVRKSTDSGATWATVDDFNFSASQSSGADAITIDGSGNIYVIGNAKDASSFIHWIVRKSIDGGATWSTVDDYALSVNKEAKGADLAIDSSGNIYATGNALDSSNLSHRIVRKSTDGGATWSTIDNFKLDIKNDYGTALTIDSTGKIYSAGYSYDASSTGHWIVRKSIDAGASWGTVDDFTYSANRDVHPVDITSDISGNIYVTGSVTAGSYKKSWMVRKSSDGGASWNTVMNYLMPDHSEGHSITVDSSGHVFTGGYQVLTVNFVSVWYWTIRKSSDGGTSWSVVEYLPSSSANLLASPNSITPCFSDRICVSGMGNFNSERPQTFHTRILSP